MVITRAPLRVSFAGGGTDLPAFYRQEDGFVVSAAIDLYVYVALNRRFDDSIRVSYSKTEIVRRPQDLEHELVRGALALMGLRKAIEIVTMADVPGDGTGLGSSSAILVALMLALHTHTRTHWELTANKLASRAAQVEIDLLKKPVGKQDHWASVFGGFRSYRFSQDGVEVRSLDMPIGCQEKLQQNLILLWTGIKRPAEPILRRLSKATATRDDTFHYLRGMKQVAEGLATSLISGDADAMGNALHEGWIRKKKTAPGVTNVTIDTAYEAAIQAGAIGGKLLGAGGGGFLLFYAPPARHEAIVRATGMRRVPVRFGVEGCRTIYG